MLRVRVVLAAALLSMGAVACRSGGAFQNAGVAPAGSVVLNVDNHNFYDMNLYVVSEGLASFIGTVNGLSKAAFRLDPSFFPTSELRVVATPIGGNGRAGTGPLIVSPGQTIDFTVGAVARESMATVH